MIDLSDWCVDRDAWKHFEGFPQKSAAMAYVFLVNQLDKENPSNSGKESQDMSEKRSEEEKAMSVVVSAFAAPLM